MAEEQKTAHRQYQRREYLRLPHGRTGHLSARLFHLWRETSFRQHEAKLTKPPGK